MEQCTCLKNENLQLSQLSQFIMWPLNPRATAYGAVMLVCIGILLLVIIWPAEKPTLTGTMLRGISRLLK